MMKLSIRRVTEEDARQLWLWANDPDVRLASFQSGRISWEEHRNWFRERLQDPLTYMYLVLDGRGSPVGVVRFQGSDHPLRHAIVSITIAPKYRRRGFGSSALGLAALQVRRESSISTLTAHIRSGNRASLQTFLKAGFQDHGTIMMNGEKTQRLVLELESLTEHGKGRPDPGRIRDRD
jgi:UDP-2,4-diacetamido-2,4,6-trideoxy-beta-L-altropyranose hydrolase